MSYFKREQHARFISGVYNRMTDKGKDLSIVAQMYGMYHADRRWLDTTIPARFMEWNKHIFVFDSFTDSWLYYGEEGGNKNAL